MANAKGASRVNGKNGENMWVEDDTICFKTAGSVERMATEVLNSLAILNAEQAREELRSSDLVAHGAWAKKAPSTSGNSMFVVAKGRANMWVMEITKNQVPNASSFVERVVPREKMSDEERLLIPNRAINTPLGALFTIGSILCVFIAVFVVFTLNQPLVGLLVAAAGIFMYINIK